MQGSSQKVISRILKFPFWCRYIHEYKEGLIEDFSERILKDSGIDVLKYQKRYKDVIKFSVNYCTRCGHYEFFILPVTFDLKTNSIKEKKG
jgi:hypothetical protein